MGNINVLVLGVGGNVSQGIVKAIRKSNLGCRVIGACISPNSIGLYMCDSAYIAPYARTSEFMHWLIDVCNKEKIDIVFTGVEENILEISKNIKQFNDNTKAIFKCTPYEKLIIGQDKYLTVEWLKNNGCNYPKYALSRNQVEIDILVKNVGFPLIAKPIRGKGSAGIFKINNNNELLTISNYKDYIIQEFIGSEHTEYTIGCYRDKRGKVLKPIIMHRELKYGTTFKAQIIEDDSIEAEAIKICEKFKPVGPLNIQLRKDIQNKPVCFELNVRFSGTTPMRAHFGFNDVEAMIKEYILGYEILDEFEVRKGLSYRYMNEMYIDTNIQDYLEKNKFIKDINDYDIEIDITGSKI